MNERLRQLASTAANTAVVLTRPNYFSPNERGELHELREELNSSTYLVRREAVRKIIAEMTMAGSGSGVNLSELFPDILRCLQSKDIETKRLVYLYISRYAVSNPELALLAVNTFVKDTEPPSAPAIRALALRTMGSLAIPGVIDYIDDPLRRALKDEDAGVRRAAVGCIGKLGVNQGEYYADMMLGEALVKVVMNDPDPGVVTTALAVLRNQNAMLAPYRPELIARLSVMLEKVGEWGIGEIFAALINHLPMTTPDQAEVIMKRASPMLTHSNPTANLSAIRLLVNYLLQYDRYITVYGKRISGCFATLLMTGSTSSEQQFVILKHLEDIVPVLPSLAPPLSTLFIHYSDPSYVRSVKLSLLVQASTTASLRSILNELAEYVKDVDVGFAEASIRTLPRLAMKFKDSNDIQQSIIQMLVEIGMTGLGHLYQASIISLRSILYLSNVRPDLSALFRIFLDDPQLVESAEGRCSLIWLLCHANLKRDDRIILDTVSLMCSGYLSEHVSVQLAILDNIGCLLLRMRHIDDHRVNIINGWFREVISMASGSTESFDLRERALLLEALLDQDIAISIGEDENAGCNSPDEESRQCPIDYTRLGFLDTILRQDQSELFLDSHCSGSSSSSDVFKDPENDVDKVVDYMNQFTI